MRLVKPSLILMLVLLLLSPQVWAKRAGTPLVVSNNQVKHVLLISVDGLHALDLANYVASHQDSTLAFLSSQGVTYTNAATSQPSDSFPGLASLITGGSPITTGF